VSLLRFQPKISMLQPHFYKKRRDSI
jgi:hypothetical protein